MDETHTPARTTGAARKLIRARGVWFWAAVITVGSVLLLWLGSQIAKWIGQDVQWYTGFGQWLGAVGSLIAAGVALWIAVTDRRQADMQRDADLACEAGLVRVTAEKLAQRRVGGRVARAAVGIRNRRSSRIFEIRVTRFVMQGHDVPLELSRINGFDLHPSERAGMYTGNITNVVVEPDQLLVLFPLGDPDVLPEYVAVEYTDANGRRWIVDTNQAVIRI
ncbi:hypothetical protein I3U85_10870 [Mycobacteroides abscessus subsp. abscessus]|uniref:hypothetical protein n=1 Tax=Mycobacteroides abscessus TaxID=36809 RepID=UPI0019D19EAB|nr:hypothetical protein [Mycobacteroides abscessus]MBN7534693.1 hypothetical protein [Mycobacteroides abscessus subsp. abscessus]